MSFTDQDDGQVHDVDLGNDDDEDDDEFPMDTEPISSRDKMDIEEFPYEVLTTEQIVKHMIDCIKEVNSVVEVIAAYRRK